MRLLDEQSELHKVTTITKRVNTISAMEPETVPDTQDYILHGKNRQEYRSILSKYQEQIRSIQSIWSIWGFAVRCRQDSCSVTGFLCVVKRNVRRLLHVSEIHAAQRRSVGLLPGAGRTRRTVRREGRSTLVPKTHPPKGVKKGGGANTPLYKIKKGGTKHPPL